MTPLFKSAKIFDFNRHDLLELLLKNYVFYPRVHPLVFEPLVTIYIPHPPSTWQTNHLPVRPTKYLPQRMCCAGKNCMFGKLVLRSCKLV